MRNWNNNGVDDGSIHPIGNGKMLVYGQGPNIMYMYGPPYSAPSFLSMHVYEKDVDLRCESKREENTAIHKLFERGGRWQWYNTKIVESGR